VDDKVAVLRGVPLFRRIQATIERRARADAAPASGKAGLAASR
jgi:hypothetical protein